MSEQNKKLFRDFVDGMNAQDLSTIEELLDENFVDHEPGPGQDPGRQGMKDMMQMFFSAFPDLKATINHLVAEDDLVTGHMTLEGTQTGEFMGIPGSDKKISITEMRMVRIVDGKATEHWGVVDSMTMMQQLGVMPED